LKRIVTTKIKPNPVGKDKANGKPLPKQLLGEWVEIRNEGDEVITVIIEHTTFDEKCNKQIEETFNVITDVQIGQSVRVHTGKMIDESQMDADDRNGAVRHEYAEKAHFILNNRCGDTITAMADGKSFSVSYERDPIEGAVLEVGNGLTVVENK
jgi:hypothetical protein